MSKITFLNKIATLTLCWPYFLKIPLEIGLVLIALSMPITAFIWGPAFLLANILKPD